jgi:hypothetical protein
MRICSSGYLNRLKNKAYEKGRADEFKRISVIVSELQENEAKLRKVLGFTIFCQIPVVEMPVLKDRRIDESSEPAITFINKEENKKAAATG